MDLNRCYERYAEYFRVTFPFVALPTYGEWVNDVSATSPAGVNTDDERSGICREQTKERPGERGNERQLCCKILVAELTSHYTSCIKAFYWPTLQI